MHNLPFQDEVSEHRVPEPQILMCEGGFGRVVAGRGSLRIDRRIAGRVCFQIDHQVSEHRRSRGTGATDPDVLGGSPNPRYHRDD